jgi:hypothetical protein
MFPFDKPRTRAGFARCHYQKFDSNWQISLFNWRVGVAMNGAKID